MNRMSYWTRPALAVMILLALGIAACTVPTSYEVGMGQKLPSRCRRRSCVDLEPRSGSLRLPGRLPGVEQAAPRSASWAGVTIDLMVWGQDRAATSRRPAPGSLASRGRDRDRAGTVRDSLAQAFGHGLRHRGRTAGRPWQILQQLAAQGFGGDARVEVVDEADGRRTIRVELSDSCMVDEAGDKVVVEPK
jgi:hypothetical protein